MKVTIQFMGPLRRLVQEAESVVELPEGSTIDEAIGLLTLRYPMLAPHVGSLLAAINEEWAERDSVLSPGVTLVLMPPVSGG
jgi:molybdopterin converting factor small subunit